MLLLVTLQQLKIDATVSLNMQFVEFCCYGKIAFCYRLEHIAVRF